MRNPKLLFEFTAVFLCLHFLVGTADEAYPGDGGDEGGVIPDGEDPGATEYTDLGETCLSANDKKACKKQEEETKKVLETGFPGRKIQVDKDQNVVFNFLFPSSSSDVPSIATRLNDTLRNSNNTIGRILKRPVNSSLGSGVVRANAYSLRFCYYEPAGNELRCGELEDSNRTRETTITKSSTNFSTNHKTVQMSPNGQQVFYTDVENGTGIWVTNLQTMHTALVVKTKFPVTKFHVDWVNARAFTVEASNVNGGSNDSVLTSWDLRRPPSSPAQVWTTSNTTVKSITSDSSTKTLYWKTENGSILKASYDSHQIEPAPEPNVTLIVAANLIGGGEFQGAPMMINNATLIYVSMLKPKEGEEGSRAVRLRLKESDTNVLFHNINPEVSGELEMTAFYSSDSQLTATKMNESCRSCSHLCVPAGLSESRCTCPYEFELKEGLTSCQRPENLTVVLADAKNSEWILAEYNVMTKGLWTLASSKTKMELLPYFGSKPQVCYKTATGNLACVDESGELHPLKPLSGPAEILAIQWSKRSKWAVYWLDSSSGCLKESTELNTFTLYCDPDLQSKTDLLVRLDPIKNLLFVIHQARRISVINWPTRVNLFRANLAYNCASNLQVDFNQTSGNGLILVCGNRIGHLDYRDLNSISLAFPNLGIDATSYFEDSHRRQWYVSSESIYTRRYDSSVTYKIYGIPDNLKPQALQSKPFSFKDYSDTTPCSHYFKTEKFSTTEPERFTCFCPREFTILDVLGTCGSVQIRSLNQSPKESLYNFGVYGADSKLLKSYFNFNFTEKPATFNYSMIHLTSGRSCYVDQSNTIQCTNGSSNAAYQNVSSNATQLVTPNVQIHDELYWLQTETENSRSCMYFARTPEEAKIKLNCFRLNQDHHIVSPVLDMRTMTLFWCQKNDSSSIIGSLQWLSLTGNTTSEAHPGEKLVECVDIALSNDRNTLALYVSTLTAVKAVTYVKSTSSAVHYEDVQDLLSFKTHEVPKSLTYFDDYLLWWTQTGTSSEYQINLLDLRPPNSSFKAQHVPTSTDAILQFDVAQTSPSRISRFTSPCETRTCLPSQVCMPFPNTVPQCWCAGENGVGKCPKDPKPDEKDETDNNGTIGGEGGESGDRHDETGGSSTWAWMLLAFLFSFITCAVCFRCIVIPDIRTLEWWQTWPRLNSIPYQFRQITSRLLPGRRQSYASNAATTSRETSPLKRKSSTCGVLETSI